MKSVVPMFALIVIASMSCKGTEGPPIGGAPTPGFSSEKEAMEALQGAAHRAQEPQPATPPEDPQGAQYEELTRGTITGDELAVFVPETLGPAKAPQKLLQAFVAAGAYSLGDGGYANLDIKGVIRGLGPDKFALCDEKIELGGRQVCSHAASDRFSLYWLIEDKIEIYLSSPSREITMKMAADLDLEGMQRFAREHETR